MPFDGLVLAAVRRELETELVGSRIQRVQQPDRLTLVIQLRAPGRGQSLLLSAHPQHARVHLTEGRFENPPVPPQFCAICRKHLEGGRVEAVTQPGFERTLHLVVAARDELGQVGQKILVAEIMGRHSNLVLVDRPSDTILDAIKRYGHTVSRYREVLPGLPYLAPPREKADPTAIGSERFSDLLLGMSFELPLWKALQQCFEGLSPLMAREVVYRAGIETDLALEFCGEHELVSIWKALQNIFADAARGRYEPCVVLGDDGAPADFAAFRIYHRDGVSEADGMNAVVDHVFSSRALDERVKAVRNGLMSALGRVRKRVEKRFEGCQRSVAEAKKAEEYREIGETLTANLYRLKENTDQVVLEHLHTGAPVEIPLDPRFTPAHNAQIYFKRYNKLRRGAERAQAELTELEAEAAYLEALETAIQLAESTADLQEIREEMAGAGYVQAKATAKRPRKPAEPQPLEVVTSDGAAVYIGRNNRQNDLVTFRLGRPDDVWLHTRDIPGAHVIIRTAGRPVSEQTLAEAASWAAWFSKARPGKKVPVDYTFRKYVQKPKGSRPGFVTYTNEKTVLVDPRPVEQ
ncbi:MAG: NFACT family protein [Candidatus Desulforudis sp.]|nr:NFACT family protein [Desulforudis sp.]